MSTSFMPDPGRSWRPFFQTERETVVGCFEEALGSRGRLSEPDRQLLEAHLQNVDLCGSRAARFPDKKLAEALANVCYRQKDIGDQVLPVVIRLWMESKSDLRTRVEKSLRSNNLAICVVTS